MIKQVINLYKPSYVNAVTYLLQANEYNAFWYLKSYQATDDFEAMSRYMRPDITPAFRAMRGFVWLILDSLYVGAIILAAVGGDWRSIAVAVGIIIMAPVLSAYIVVLPLLLADLLIRRPRDNKMIREATEVFKTHKAIKIGVVGSYGKTTMKEILSETLGAGMKVAATPGNYNTPVGVSRFAAELNGKEDIIIVEMGEYIPGDITKICQIVAPDYGVVTGINEQHMQRMGTIENTIRTIFEIADFVDKDKILVNTDSALVKRSADKKNVAYNSKRAGSWKVSKVKTDVEGTKFTATKGKTKMNICSELLGKHQIGPLMAGVYLCNRLGETKEEIIRGLSKTKPHGRRFNSRVLDNGAIFIDDTYNGNPDGFLVGINFLSDLKNTNTVYITGGIIELGEDKIRLHQMLGSELAKSNINRILLIETPATEWMVEGFEQVKTKKKFEWIKPEAEIYDNIEQFTVDGEVALMQNWHRENVFYEL